MGIIRELNFIFWMYQWIGNNVIIYSVCGKQVVWVFNRLNEPIL